MNATIFKLKDASSYDAVTESFDRFTQWQTAPLIGPVLRAAKIGSGQTVLDVGTGSGIVALQAGREVSATGSVLGIDLSEGMLSFAERRSQAEGLEWVRYRKMDAEAMDLDARTFDAVTSLFSLFHFPNPATAVREFYRVLRPGGRCAVAVGTGPPLFSRAGVRQGLKRIMRRLTPKADMLIAPRCLETFLAHRLPVNTEPEVAGWTKGRFVHRRIRGMFNSAGFVDVQDKWVGHETSFDNADEFWEVQATFSSMARKRLAATAASRVHEIRKEFHSVCLDVLERGGKLIYPSGAYIVSASRPLKQELFG